MSEEKPKPRVSKIQWALFGVAILSLVVAFTGVNFQSVSSYFSETFLFPKADHIVKSLATPTILPSDFRLSLSVSPEYFVATSVNLKSERPYQGEPMQFSVSFDNKGKKSVEQPRLMVYFSDYMYRVWNVWNESITNDVFVRGCSFEYHFPPIDQKTIGAWVVFALLYDDAEGVLVSYVAREFMVTDVAPTPLWQNPIFLFFLAYLAFFSLLMVWRRKSFLKIFDIFRRRKDNESEKERKVKANEDS